MTPITQLLEAARAGDRQAAADLLPLLYHELRQLATAKVAKEGAGQTLNATALVHEAYLRLVGEQRFDGRGHFFAAAAEAMRRLLVEQARRRLTRKRGGELQRSELHESEIAATEPNVDLIELDDALTQLAATDALTAELVKLRYFVGLTSAEAAEILGISARTADRTWAYARAWLHQRLKD